MTAEYFLDTNIIVYAFDNQDVRKRDIARKYMAYLSEDEEYVLSSQVLNEFCNVAFKKLKPPMSIKDVTVFIYSIPESRILPLTKNTVLKALELKGNYKFSIWDSLIIATAIIAECDYILTENISHSQRIESIEIINPFI